MPDATTEPRFTDAQATANERTYATFQHLTLLLAPAGFLCIVASLIMWNIKKDESPFLDDHGRESLNFQISLLIYSACAGVLAFIGIGIPIGVGIVVLGLVGMIMAARAANRGEYFRYPMCIRLLN